MKKFIDMNRSEWKEWKHIQEEKSLKRKSSDMKYYKKNKERKMSYQRFYRAHKKKEENERTLLIEEWVDEIDRKHEEMLKEKNGNHVRSRFKVEVMRNKKTGITTVNSSFRLSLLPEDYMAVLRQLKRVSWTINNHPNH